MISEYPSLEWFRDPENWARWSGLLNMRFTAELADMVRGGADMGTAVNELIEIEAQRMIAHDIPAQIIAAFVEQYHDKRAEVMAAAAVWIRPHRP